MYTLVYLVYNTISNLLTQTEQVACFRNAARHLTPGGRFVIELWVPALRTLPPGQQAIAFNSEPGYIGVDTYDMLHQHVVSHHFRFGTGRPTRLFRSPHRYIWPSELDLMAQIAGFELEARHADWTGAEFTAESPSHVSVYQLTAAFQERGVQPGAARPPCGPPGTRCWRSMVCPCRHGKGRGSGSIRRGRRPAGASGRRCCRTRDPRPPAPSAACWSRSSPVTR